MKYTAIEILKLAGVEEPERKLGAVAITIGGLNVNTPDHLINFQDSEKTQVIVGNDVYDIDVPRTPQGLSEGAQAAIEAKGRKATENAEALAKAKAEAKEAPAPEESEDKG